MHSNKRLYLLPSLGADYRLFHKLQLDFPNQLYINYPDPLRNESLDAYINRIVTQIDVEKDIYLLGISYGGMIATEIAKKVNPKKVVYINTMKHSDEVPIHFRMARKLKIYKLLTPKIAKETGGFSKWPFFPPKQDTDYQLFYKMLVETKDEHLRWAIEKFVHWENTELPEKWLHIQSDKELIFPAKKIIDPVILKGARHYPVFTHVEELANLVNAFLED